jgi:hypothetical protein
MTQAKLPQRGWVAGGIRLRLVLFDACLERSKRRSHVLSPELLASARERIRPALERYGERRVRTPYVTATEQNDRLGKISVAARRLAAAPTNAKWRSRLETAIAPLFLKDPSTADFANHVLVEFELKLGLDRPRGLPQFLDTLRSRKQLDDDDVGRCRALAAVTSRQWGPGSRHPYFASSGPDTNRERDPHKPDFRDPHMITLIDELESVWVDLTGKGILARDAVDDSVYFAKWLSLVVRKATRGKLRPSPGTIIDAAVALQKSKTAARGAESPPV